ncbi:MAG TPA: amidohydrolase family protein [Candidatus Dormibacteraeota bacterium]|nr:amidohydrolase family protein [Candidatus Dormibacteraeota bacterium]
MIVDAHLHLYRTAREGVQGKAAYPIWEYGERDEVQFADHSGDVESAIEAMDRAGASVAVVTNLLDVVRPGVAPADDLRSLNRWLCDLAAVDRRFFPLIAVDPNHLDVADNIAHLEEMVQHHGAQGIKLHPPLQRIDLADPAVWPILEACVRLDVVVVCHGGPSRDGPGVGEPDAIRPVLEAVPGLRIVLAHMGGATWRQLPGLARDYPHVSFDLSEIIEWLGAPKAPSPSEMADLIRAVGTQRVMMGSDFPWYDIDHTVQQVSSLPGLSARDKEAILGGNAVEFFRLSL